MPQDVGLFSAEQVLPLAKITERQLRHWARSGFYRPEHLDEDGGPFSHVYSFRDVVSLRTIGVLTNRHKVPVTALRRAGEWLSERHHWPWSSLAFRISGRGLYYIDPVTKQPVALTGPLGQQAHPGLVKLEAIALRVRRAVADMKKRKARDIGKVARNRNVASNASMIAGTRIPTATIWRLRRAGYTADQIINEFPRLTRKDVEAAVSYEDARHPLAS